MQMPPLWDQTGVPGEVSFTHFHSLDDVGLRLVDELAHPFQHRASPVAELANALVDQLVSERHLGGARLSLPTHAAIFSSSASNFDRVADINDWWR